MLQKHINDVRAFNRFYTRIIGLLDKYLPGGNYTLPEVRVMYELYHNENVPASDIVQAIDIDKSYLSRILSQFEKKKLIAKKRSVEDGRSALIALTPKGKKEFELLNEATNVQVKAMLSQLPAADCNRLIHHMTEIKKILANAGNTTI
jgi:DNA-binding MarR family transcriptional regulator